MKNVAAYDLDPVNGGLIKYAKGQTDPFLGVAMVPELDSIAEFFTGTMLDNAPDAIVLDLPGNPLHHFGRGMTREDMISILFGPAEFGFIPVPLYPVTPKTVSTDSLAAALASFPSGPFGVCLNEYGINPVTLQQNKGFPNYLPMAEQVRRLDGQEFRLPDLQGLTMKDAIDNLMLPFEVGFPVRADGSSLNGKEMLEELSAWLTAHGASSSSCRAAYSGYRLFLEKALPEIEQFVDYVDQKMAVLGGRPVYMPYSDKGGEGKSYLTRLLTVYLRRYWANGLLYMDSPLT